MRDLAGRLTDFERPSSFPTAKAAAALPALTRFNVICSYISRETAKRCRMQPPSAPGAGKSVVDALPDNAQTEGQAPYGDLVQKLMRDRNEHK